MSIIVAPERTIERQPISEQSLDKLWREARSYRQRLTSVIAQHKSRWSRSSSPKLPRLDSTVDYRFVDRRHDETGNELVVRAKVLRARHAFKDTTATLYVSASSQEVPAQLVIAGHGGSIVVSMHTGRGFATVNGRREEIELLQPLTPGEIAADAARRRSPDAIAAMSDAELGRAIRAHMSTGAIAEAIGRYC
jgi:hypothetical protein